MRPRSGLGPSPFGLYSRRWPAAAAWILASGTPARDLGPRGIRVNTVSPGPVETALWLGPDGVAATVAKATGVDRETARKQVVEQQGGLATGRFTRPEEVADLVLFLASERAGNITG